MKKENKKIKNQTKTSDAKELNREDLENKEQVLPVDNDIRVVIKSKEDGILFDQDCCTVVNIILNNYNEIATSFLGIHNETIIKQLWKAQKAYFKALKKTLKEERKHASAESQESEEIQDKKETKDDVFHIKEFTQDNNKTSDDPKNNDLINPNTSSYEHICDENGCRLVKKKVDSVGSKSQKTKSDKKNKSN